MELLNILACPECHSALKVGSDSGEGHRVLFCTKCPAGYFDDNGIIYMMPIGTAGDPAYKSDIDRYNEIARTGLSYYRGLKDTRPYSRSCYIREMLQIVKVHEFIDVGPGFGYLEELTWAFDRIAVDEAVEFLKYIRAGVPGVCCINAIAERLPFKDSSVPCVVADSTFQTVTDRPKFLQELARVLKPSGYLIMSIAYSWNYPRKPQDGYDVTKPEELAKLKSDIKALGLAAGYSYLDTWTMKWQEKQEEANYLWILARKKPV